MALVAFLGIPAIMALRKSEITLRGRTFCMPFRSLLSGQLLFTAIDILMAATVLYLLLPPNDMGFATFLAVFAAAIFAGVASHVPGGLVFSRPSYSRPCPL